MSVKGLWWRSLALLLTGVGLGMLIAGDRSYWTLRWRLS